MVWWAEETFALDNIFSSLEMRMFTMLVMLRSQKFNQILIEQKEINRTIF